MAEDGLSYKDSGVDIEAGDRAVELIRRAVESTTRPEVVGGVGGFSGAFRLGAYRDPLLVSGTDGVGTKLKLAFMMDVHDTVGIDLVAMCANDVATSGAECLFFLDYLATGRLEPEKAAKIVEGVAAGCRQAGCALVGGEMAEMPGFYADGEYDLAGFCVGVVERDRALGSDAMTEGDLVLGWPSSGCHSNGFSLTRKLFFDNLGWSVDRHVDELGRTLGEELLTPTRVYAVQCHKLARAGLVKGLAHITGGGLTGNLPRILPPGLSARIDPGAWAVPPIFDLIRTEGRVGEQEMRRTFNMGIGLALVVGADKADAAASLSREQGLECMVIGRLVAGGGGVEYGSL